MPLLLEYFKEDANQLYLVMDSASSLEEMEAAITDVTPKLIVLGRSLYDREAVCRIFIEKKECVYVDNVLQGFLVVFLAYFVFGLKYPQKLKSTLEFIQRIFLDINPEQERKQVEGPGRQRTVIDSKCYTLCENIATFRARDVGI
ncbi:uncharacterized protein LOC107040131 [Diachasma alloeum]|uniref:uncharacterized protein LOC107040131 n=1 Tax=Diachasma alloeum TaxID=454923 RepID=UPI0007382B14|nr:uncharacterized protein LOC107040131 [Diachasma alloeum]